MTRPRITVAARPPQLHEHEPQVAAGLSNVVLCPHPGSATVETRTAMAELAARDALAGFRGEPLLTPVGG